MTIKRYEMRNGHRGEDLYEHENGPVVQYADHAAEVSRLSALVPRWATYDEAARMIESGEWFSETCRIREDQEVFYLMRPRDLPPLPGTETP